MKAQTTGVLTSGFRAEAPGGVQVIVRYGDLEQAQSVLQATEKDRIRDESACSRCSLPPLYEQMKEADLLRLGISFLWLAGKTYKQDLSRMLKDFQHCDPLAGLGIGLRLAWLKVGTTAE